MGEIVLTIRVSEQVLQCLRRRYALKSDVETVEAALAACGENADAASAAPRGWEALDLMIGALHGDGTAGADEHDRWGLGAQL